MSTLHPDLLLLAAVNQAYGSSDAAEVLYCLADYGSHFTPPMSVSDMQAGLSILKMDSYRLVAPGLRVPDLLEQPLLSGRVVLAQVRGYPLRKVDYWIALTGIDNAEWHGIAIGLDWAQVGIAAHMGHTLTGFYLVLAEPLPDWQK